MHTKCWKPFLCAAMISALPGTARPFQPSPTDFDAGMPPARPALKGWLERRFIGSPLSQLLDYYEFPVADVIPDSSDGQKWMLIVLPSDEHYLRNFTIIVEGTPAMKKVPKEDTEKYWKPGILRNAVITEIVFANEVPQYELDYSQEEWHQALKRIGIARRKWADEVAATDVTSSHCERRLQVNPSRDCSCSKRALRLGCLRRLFRR